MTVEGMNHRKWSSGEQPVGDSSRTSDGSGLRRVGMEDRRFFPKKDLKQFPGRHQILKRMDLPLQLRDSQEPAGMLPDQVFGVSFRGGWISRNQDRLPSVVIKRMGQQNHLVCWSAHIQPGDDSEDLGFIRSVHPVSACLPSGIPFPIRPAEGTGE